MKCANCGTENPINRLYCDECGAELEHDLAQVQASVDAEIRKEKKASAAQSIRWLLGVAFVLFIAGSYFRRAYKDLPANDIVAFLAAPTFDIGTLGTVGTTNFGVSLPEPARIPPPRPQRYEPGITAQLAQDAYGRACVSVRHKRSKEPIRGLLVGDLVFYIAAPGQKEPKAVHIADVRSLRPIDGKLWEIGAIGIDKPVQVPIPEVETTRLQVLRKRPDGKVTTDTIPFETILEIRPS
jgi:hypothetical protein